MNLSFPEESVNKPITPIAVPPYLGYLLNADDAGSLAVALDFNPTDADSKATNETILREAIRLGKKQTIEVLFKRSVGLDGVDSVCYSLFKTTALSNAVRTKLAVLFIELGGEPSREDIVSFMLDSNIAALRLFSCCFDYSALDLLTGQTWLCWTILFCQPAVPMFLLEHGVDCTGVISQTGWTPLHLAVEKRKLSLIGPLVSRGVDVNFVDKEGNTALSLVCSHVTFSHEERMRTAGCLLENGADPSLGWPLAGVCNYDASASRRKDFIGVLHRFGTNINYQREDGHTVLSLQLIPRVPEAVCEYRCSTFIRLGVRLPDDWQRLSLRAPLSIAHELLLVGLVNTAEAQKIYEGINCPPLAQPLPPFQPPDLASEKIKSLRAQMIETRGRNVWQLYVHPLCRNMAIGLAGKDLPALVVLTIVDLICGVDAEYVRMSLKWDLIVRVKNMWKQRKAAGASQ